MFTLLLVSSTVLNNEFSDDSFYEQSDSKSDNSDDFCTFMYNMWFSTIKGDKTVFTVSCLFQ